MNDDEQNPTDRGISATVAKLESLFSTFNDRFYGGALQMPVITVSPSGRRKACYGWCTTWKAWQDGSDQTEDTDGGYFEINLCAEYLARPFQETCATLLHEMAHLYSLQQDVQDTSRSGLYHNKRFRETAEKHGLMVEKSERYGFSKTRLNGEAASFADSLNEEAFKLHRDGFSSVELSEEGAPMPDVPKKSSTIKYVCPECKLIIRATKEVQVLCVKCNIQFVKSDTLATLGRTQEKSLSEKDFFSGLTIVSPQ